jgi:2-methylcitrate dehydratase
MLRRTISRELAEFAYGIRYADLPPAVIETARGRLIDTLGCALGATRLRDSLILRENAFLQGGNAEATLIGYGDRLPASVVAMVNAQLVRALDFNDVYWRDDACNPSVLIPVALAAGEASGASMEEVLTTLVLGYEILTRLTKAAVPPIRQRHFHRATFVGIVAPLVAGRALGLSTEQMVHALGLGTSRAVVLGCAGSGRQGISRLIPEAFAAQTGVQMAQLAKRGLTSTDGIFEGKEGLFEALGREWAEERVTQGLGKKWKILDVTTKAWPVQTLMQPPLAALAQIVRERLLKTAEIESITVHTLTRTREINFSAPRYSAETSEAAFQSLPLCLATLALEGKLTPSSFTPERLADAPTRALAQKVKAVAAGDLDREFPLRHGARVVVRTLGGTEHSASVDWPKGDPRNPMGPEDIRGKFLQLSSQLFSPEQANNIVDKLGECEKLKPAALMKLLVSQNR